MDEIENLKTDANIANILQKLKENSKTKEVTTDVDQPTEKEPLKEIDSNSMMVDVTDIPVNTLSKNNDSNVSHEEVQEEVDIDIEACDMQNDLILPWLSKSDLDLKLLHYITSADNGDLIYNTIKTDRSPAEIASLKLKPNYICDIDYYNSKHYVLYVKQIDSNYGNSLTYSTEKNQTSESLLKTSSDDAYNKLHTDEKFSQYIVFTDLGVIDFIVKSDYVSYPFNNIDLNKWLEETSNYVTLINPHYSVNPHVVSCDSIREYKYDIVSMPRPGVLVLDSMDNTDQNYKLCVTLKDQYKFIPINRILCCLKSYSQNKKSFDHFKRFICKYFNIIR